MIHISITAICLNLVIGFLSGYGCKSGLRYQVGWVVVFLANGILATVQGWP